MGSTICTDGFASAAIASSCFTARCDSIWYGFFIATLLFLGKRNCSQPIKGFERGSRYFLRSTGHSLVQASNDNPACGFAGSCSSRIFLATSDVSLRAELTLTGIFIVTALDRFRANTSTSIIPSRILAFLGRKNGSSMSSSCPPCRKRSHSRLYLSEGDSQRHGGHEELIELPFFL